MCGLCSPSQAAGPDRNAEEIYRHERRVASPLLRQQARLVKFLLCPLHIGSLLVDLHHHRCRWNRIRWGVDVRRAIAMALPDRGLALLRATTMGTLAALAWLMASFVCGRTPSSQATTTMAMSVTLVPRALIALNACSSDNPHDTPG